MRRGLLLLVVMLSALLGPRDPASADERCFSDVPSISACLEEPFQHFWTAHGGLPVFGYPISSAQPERNPDLNRDLITQWTERNRLEIHSENAPPYDILLGRMGAERLAQLGRDPFAEGREPGPQAGCLWFETTGHNVCDQAQVPAGPLGFKSYWQSHGLDLGEPGISYRESLALFGLPLTAPRMETNANGDTVLTQWFERARFEWHPNQPDQYKVLLGLLGNELRAAPGGVRPPASLVGVEINSGRVARTAGRATEAGVKWVRYGSILWSDVEATRGARDWSKLANAERELQLLAAQGLSPLVVVRGTPAWAQQVPGASCGPIRADALDAFAGFMAELVARYSKPPYNVEHWEIWNEPDIDPRLVGGDSGFGCWGDASDPYYGGGYYAEMLKRVYPAVKRANPRAQVVVGGLVLDCDPENPPAGVSCQPARFLEGILRNGGAAAFDILAYHSYVYWGPGTHDADLQNARWRHRGGALLGKLDFLRGVLASYGVAKPMLMGEGGLLCYSSCPEAELRSAQANHVVRLYTRAWANGLLGALWYTLDGPGWREAGLLDAAGSPRPAYWALAFMTSRLHGAEYLSRLTHGSVEGYAFRKGPTRYEIYWTNDGSTAGLPTPAGTRQVYDLFGQPLGVGAQLQVGFNPVYVEIQQ